MFPDGVKLLCSLFVGMLLNDEWEKKSDHTQRIVIFGENNRCIKRTRGPFPYEYTTSICGKMVANCSYIWKLQIGKCSESQFGSLIGIIPNHKVADDKGNFIALKSRFDISPYNGYSFWSYGGGSIQNDEYNTKSYGTKLVPNDIIEIHLNLNKLTIEFVINGENQGIAFENIEDTEYRLIVVIYNDDHIKLLDVI